MLNLCIWGRFKSVKCYMKSICSASIQAMKMLILNTNQLDNISFYYGLENASK